VVSQLLGRLAQGRSNAGMAEGLFISEKAVAKHIGNIFTKLGLPPSDTDNRRVLAVLAYLDRQGLSQRPDITLTTSPGVSPGCAS